MHLFMPKRKPQDFTDGSGSVGIALRRARKEANYSLSKTARIAGVSISLLGMIERGDHSITSVGQQNIANFPEAYGLSAEEFSRITGAVIVRPASNDEPDPMAHMRVSPEFIKLQRIGWVNAGDSEVYKLAPLEEYDEVPKNQLVKKQCVIKNCFTYVVNGDSMVTDGAKNHPKGISDGDIIVIEKHRLVMPEDIVVIWDKRDQKMLVKAVAEGADDGYLVFKSLNSRYPPIFRHESEIKIYGVKVWRGG